MRTRKAPARRLRCGGFGAMGASAIVAVLLLQDQSIASTRLLNVAQSNSAADNEKKNEKAGTPATVVDGQQLESVLGLDAINAKGDNMGRIVDIIVDRTGQARAAIIDFGGFLGVGSRKIAVDWSPLLFPQPGKPGERIPLALTRDQVKPAPEYREGKPVVILGALGKLESLPE